MTIETDPLYDNIGEKTIKERMEIIKLEVDQYGLLEGCKRYFEKSTGLDESKEE